jgi:CubicO group peptidase (beta-lactamase class C family)
MEYEALRTERRRLMQRHDVPGVALGILWNGRAHTICEGVTGVDHPLPVTDDTLFQVGSVTKTVTATIIMRLVERDEIDLDAPVRRYVAEFRLADEDAAAAVTVRHLLTHTAGWPGEYSVDTGWGRRLRRALDRRRVRGHTLRRTIAGWMRSGGPPSPTARTRATP